MSVENLELIYSINDKANDKAYKVAIIYIYIYIYKVYFTMLRSLLALSILCLFVIYSFNSSSS